jgi:tetratricopeptide (TPR) repeat protein
MSLIAESPVTGHGFGLFEKSYNEHVAHAGLPSNGYIKMAYNDFIELSVEGGLIAAFLWLAFIFSYFLYSRKNNYSLFPLIALVAIQLSNFVFQAVPVFALLIVYLALPTPYSALSTESSMIKKSRGLLSSKVKPISISMAIIAFALLVHQVRFANAFYKTDKIEKQYTPTLSIPEYKKLEPALEGHAYLHEKLGDSYMKTKKIHKALNEFTTALGTMYTPELLVKSGFCYQLQNKYDSSLYYYRLAHNIEPFKFATQHLILRLYEQKKDTGNIIKTATTIVNMPVKVENPRAYQLKTYAQNTINKILQQ